MPNAAEDPKVFTRIHFHFVSRAKTSIPSTCHAPSHCRRRSTLGFIMLGKTAQITHDYEIRAPA